MISCGANHYNATEHKLFLKNWFADYHGIIHADADPFFDDLAITPGIQLSYCNAHARRKFEPIAKAIQAEGLAKRAKLSAIFSWLAIIILY